MTLGDGTTTRPHRAARVEAHIRGAIGRGLRRRGWRPAVVPHIGYAGAGWVRLLARVLLVPPGSPRPGREDGRGWRRFLTTAAPGVPVTVRVGERTHVVTSAREGYLDVRLDGDLPPGLSSITCEVEGRPPVTAPVRVVGPQTRLGVVSDLDDTVIDTVLPRPLVALRNAFWVRENERRAVAGMAGLYAEIGSAHPDVFVVYLSTGAWNTAQPLTAFLARHGFPPGPLLLTDWGPTATGWFRSGQAHKRAELARLFAEHPDLRWLLVGDDGQHDPTLYAEAATAAPDRVVAVAIRQLGLTRRVVVHGRPTPPDDSPVAPSSPVPVVRAPDGAGLLDALRDLGVVPPPTG